MKEIKFRSYDKKRKVMDYHPYGDEFICEGTPINACLNGYPFNEEGGQVLMQYTGLKDKNGKEIYEGDIVKYNCSGIGKEGVCVIHELSPSQGFFVNVPDDVTDGDVFLEVIGSIYENPELLDQQQKQ